MKSIMERKDEVKVYQNKNVYEAFNHRLEYICGYFDHLIISCWNWFVFIMKVMIG